MAQVKINGITYGLRFDLGALEAVEEEFGDLKAVFQNMKGGEHRLDTIKKMFAIMANCQLEFEGKPASVTVSALKHAPLAALNPLGEAITAAIQESMHVETVNGEADDDVHDGYLEEIDAKNVQTGD